MHRPQLLLWNGDRCQDCKLLWINCYCACCVILWITCVYQCEQFNLCSVWFEQQAQQRDECIEVEWRTAIYETIESCQWVFHPISAEISNVNSNNLQVFKGYVITFSLWGCCWKACSLKLRKEWFGWDVMRWKPIAELVMKDSVRKTKYIQRLKILQFTLESQMQDIPGLPLVESSLSSCFSPDLEQQ